MTVLRSEVVRFLEAQAMLNVADTERKAAEARYRQADTDFRRAWDALTSSEASMVNDACRALEEPETRE